MEVYKSDQDYFYDFLNSGLHGAKWPMGYVVAILVYGFNEIYNYCLYGQNEAGGKHAEELLMAGLSKVLSNRSWKDVSTMRMYINVSPCWRCSNKIIIFYAEARAKNYGRCMEIVFAAPYKWFRESCASCGHKMPTHEDHKKMIEALQKLGSVYGIIVRTFEKQDWDRLAKNFGITNFIYDGHPRKWEDMEMWSDFDRALESVRSSKEENSQRLRAPVQAISDTMGAMTLRPGSRIERESSASHASESQPFMPSSSLTSLTTEEDEPVAGAAAAMSPQTNALPLDMGINYRKKGLATAGVVTTNALPLDMGINYRKKALATAGVLTTAPPVEDGRDEDIRKVIVVEGFHGKVNIHQKPWAE